MEIVLGSAAVGAQACTKWKAVMDKGVEARASGFAVWEMITPEGVLPLARAMLAEPMKALKEAQEDTSPAKLDVTSNCPSCHSTAAAAALVSMYGRGVA